MASGAAVEVPLGEALEARWTEPPGSDRFIFHVAFCGSTFLATALDVPGRSFGQREPKVLNDVADACGSRSNASVVSALGLTRALLRRRWRPGEQNFCKPSNWANNLIPIMTRHSHRIRPLFVGIDGRDYLIAMFRGGRERAEYVHLATRHLLGRRLSGDALWNEAKRGVGLEVVARIGLVSLHRQLGLFKDAMGRGGWTGSNLLSLRQIEEDPFCACMLAKRALGLDITWAEIARAVEKYSNVYAKMPGWSYSRDERRILNTQIENEYGRVFDRALDWAARMGLRTDMASLLPAVETAERAA